MKKELSPGLVFAVIAVAVLLIGGAIYYFTGVSGGLTGAQQMTRDNMIKAKEAERQQGAAQRGR